MRIAKISTALALILGLAACEQMGGMGGGNTESNAATTNTGIGTDSELQGPGSTDGTEEGGAADAAGL